MTRVIGLTGGIACGKSTASNILREKGIPVVDCDQIARQVVEPGTNGFVRVVKAFGPEIVRDDGSGLDRLKLGEIVFKDAEQRKRLTTITGPLIFREIAKQVIYNFFIGTPIVVIDAPILYESKTLLHICSEVIVIAATKEHQLERIRKRDGLSEESALDRINAQIPVEEKAKMAHTAIWNDSTEEEFRTEVNKVVEDLESRYKFGPAVLLSGPGIVFVIFTVLAGFKLNAWYHASS